MPSSIPASPASTPAAEVEISIPLARRLLQTQFPDIAEQTIERIDAGWDNEMYRLGDRLALRFPRRRAAAALIELEQRWLPEIAPRLPVLVPVPVHIGKPAYGFPWQWSVLPWLSGTPADQSELTDDGTLAAFFKALHVEAPARAPHNPSRGVPLRQRADAIEERIKRLRVNNVALNPAVLEIWQTALATPIDCPATWIHGDMHARNVLVENDRISGVIDWGDIAAGDRATDLAAVWTLLPSAADRRHVIESCASVTETTWARARGWSVLFGIVLLDTGLIDHPRHAAMGRKILNRLAEGP